MADLKVQRLRNFKVSCVAILDQPSAVGAFGVYKSQEGQPEGMVGQALCKFVEAPGEEGLLYSLILVPDRVDRHGHWVSKEDTKRACHSWGSEGCPMDLNHGEEFGGKALAKSQVAAVENLIIQPGDHRFDEITIDGETVNPEGAWGTIVEIRDEELKKMAREGKLNELSLYSPPGQYELVDEALPTPGGDQQPMSDTKLEALDKKLDSLVEGLSGLVKALTPSKEEKVEKVEKTETKEPAPDLTDLAVVDKMAREAAIVKMQAEYHIGDAEKQDLLGYREALAKMLEAEAKSKEALVKSARTATVEDGKPAANQETKADGSALAKSFFRKPQESK